MKHIFEQAHPDWHSILLKALSTMDGEYLQSIFADNSWFPGQGQCFAAFSRPLSTIQTVLLGESPYPRAASANGYAFWDAQVGGLWSNTGLAITVNRATSLRNFIKMLLVARGDLGEDVSQVAIAACNKSQLVQTASELFQGMLDRGFLLLNASLVFRAGKVQQDAKAWLSFMRTVLHQLSLQKSNLNLLLFGKVAQNYEGFDSFQCLKAEHPYNISFIQNPNVVQFFKPLDLLKIQ